MKSLNPPAADEGDNRADSRMSLEMRPGQAANRGAIYFSSRANNIARGVWLRLLHRGDRGEAARGHDHPVGDDNVEYIYVDILFAVHLLVCLGAQVPALK